MWELIDRNRMTAAAFLVAAVYCPAILSGGFSPRWWVLAVALPLTSDLDPRNVSPSILLCLIGGLLWAAGSLLITPDPQVAVLDLFFLALLALTMIAAAGIENLDPVIAAFGWGLAVSCALAIPQFFGWSIVNQITSPSGTFMNSEVLAEIAAPILAWSIFKRRWALVAMTAIPLAVCNSRIAIFSAAVGLLSGWNASNRWMKPAIMTAFVVGAVGSIGLVGIDKASSGLTRIVLWVSGIESFVPLGRGLGWWAFSHPGSFEEFAHSDVIQIVVELGLGSAFFLAIPILLFFQRGNSDQGERAIYGAILVELLVSFPLHFPASGFLVALLAGRLARSRSFVCDRELLRGEIAFPSFRRKKSFLGGLGVGGRDYAEGLSVRSSPSQFGNMDSIARARALKPRGL